MKPDHGIILRRLGTNDLKSMRALNQLFGRVFDGRN